MENLRLKEQLSESRSADKKKFQSWTRILDGSEDPSVVGVIPRILSTLTLGGVSCDGNGTCPLDVSPEDCLFEPSLFPVTKEVYRINFAKYKSGRGALPPNDLWCLTTGTDDDHLILARSGETVVYRVCFSFVNDDVAHVCGSVSLKHPFNHCLVMCDRGHKLVCGIRKKGGTSICLLDMVADHEITSFGNLVATEADVAACGQIEDGKYFSFHKDATLAIWSYNGSLIYKQTIGYRAACSVRAVTYIAALQIILVVYDGLSCCLVAWKVTSRKCRFSSCLRLRNEIKGITEAEHMSAESPQTLCLRTSDGNYIVLMPVQMLQKYSDIKDMDALCLDSGATHPDAAQLLYNYNGIGICATANHQTGISIWTLEGGELMSRVPVSMLVPQLLNGTRERAVSRRRSQSNFQSLLSSSIKTTGTSIAPVLHSERDPGKHSSSASTGMMNQSEYADEYWQTQLRWFKINDRWYLAVAYGLDNLTILDPFDVVPQFA